MTNKSTQYYNSLIARLFLGATILETYYKPVEPGKERQVDHLLLDFGAKREFPNSRYWADTCLPIHEDFNWTMMVVQKYYEQPNTRDIELSTDINYVYQQLCDFIDIINEKANTNKK
jgi:hypothetical protein